MKTKNKSLISKFFPVTVVVLIALLMFFKIVTKGYYPIPGDLLVSFYFPWYSGGWEGYNPWTTHKELLGSDSIRQIYVWKELAFEEIKKGNLPLWNPYTFSGQPLAANFQSSAYYPLNILYFIFDAKNSWILLIISQVVLVGAFTYLAARSLKLNKTASVFSAVALMYSSYVVAWLELGTVIHSYAFFPLSLWAINEFFNSKKYRFLFVQIAALTLSILAGHPQTTIYLYIFTAIYWFYKTYEDKNLKKGILTLTAVVTFSLTSVALQLIPTYEFYKMSPISLPFSREVFDRAIFPHQNLITFFASDFFGHPANNNYWSRTYGDFTPYIGVVPIIFALWAVVSLWKNNFIKFASITSALFIVAAINSPITWAIRTFHIPLLDSTTPSRFVSITIFLLALLAGFGFGDFITNLNKESYLKKFLKFLLLISFIYLGMWLFAILGTKFLEPKDVWSTNLHVTKRNLILPTGTFLGIFALAVTLFKVKIFRQLETVIVLGLFFSTLVGGLYFSNKFQPFATKTFIFPDHPLFAWLKENGGINRFYGGGTSHIDFNFPTHYEVFGAEGYDTLRYQRYAELLASGFTGSVPEIYLRSDAVFANEENGYRKKLFNLLGVKYLLNKEDDLTKSSTWRYDLFPGDRTTGVWNWDKFQVYERQDVLPRAFLTTDYQVIKEGQDIIKKIYEDKNNLYSVILEKEPALKIDNNNQAIQEPELISYEPTKVEFKTKTNENQLLYFSDVFDPNWKVYVDDDQTELLRAHYALRAVAVPQGEHKILFKYQPQSTKSGFIISSASLILLASFAIYSKKTHTL